MQPPHFFEDTVFTTERKEVGSEKGFALLMIFTGCKTGFPWRSNLSSVEKKIPGNVLFTYIEVNEAVVFYIFFNK